MKPFPAPPALKHTLFRTAVSILRLFPPGRLENRRQTLVIYKPDRIGDFILALGCIRHLVHWAAAHRSMRSVIVVSERNYALAVREFPECHVAAVPDTEDGDGFRSGFLRCMQGAHRTLQGLRGGCVVSLRHQLTLTQDLLLDWLTPHESFALEGSPNAVPLGLEKARKFRPSRSGPYPAPNPDVASPLELVAHARVASLVTGAQVSPSSISPRLISFPITDTGSLAVFPAAYHAIRTYPPDRLIEAIQAIPRNLFARVELHGSPREEKALAQYLRRFDSTMPPAAIVISPNITVATERIASARAILSMESGPAHLATALNKPGVFILGGGHYGIFAPWGDPDRQIWLHHPLPCYGCDWKCRFESPYCITDIPPRALVDALKQVVAVQ